MCFVHSQYKGGGLRPPPQRGGRPSAPRPFVVSFVLAVNRARVLALNPAHVLRLGGADKADVLDLNKAHVLRLNMPSVHCLRVYQRTSGEGLGSLWGELWAPGGQGGPGEELGSTQTALGIENIENHWMLFVFGRRTARRWQKQFVFICFWGVMFKNTVFF